MLLCSKIITIILKKLSTIDKISKSDIRITSLSIDLSLCFRLVYRIWSIAAYPLWFAIKKYRLFPEKQQIFPDLKIVKKCAHPPSVQLLISQKLTAAAAATLRESTSWYIGIFTV